MLLLAAASIALKGHAAHVRDSNSLSLRWWQGARLGSPLPWHIEPKPPGNSEDLRRLLQVLHHHRGHLKDPGGRGTPGCPAWTGPSRGRLRQNTTEEYAPPTTPTGPAHGLGLSAISAQELDITQRSPVALRNSLAWFCIRTAATCLVASQCQTLVSSGGLCSPEEGCSRLGETEYVRWVFADFTHAGA